MQLFPFEFGCSNNIAQLYIILEAVGLQDSIKFQFRILNIWLQ